MRFDKSLDLLKRQLVVWHSGREIEISRELTQAERVGLVARIEETGRALMPFGPSEEKQVQLALLGMFTATQTYTDDPEMALTVFKSLVREFPAWAIEEACFAIAKGDSLLQSGAKPTGRDLTAECRRVTRLYREARDDAKSLLEATVAPHRGVAHASIPNRGGETTPKAQTCSSEASQ